LKSKSCILFFARTAKCELAFKQFHHSSKINYKIHELLYKRTLNTITKSGIPVIIWNEHKQEGSCFGSKLAHAFDSVFQKGFEQVIAVGSDSPELNISQIKKADQLLRSNRMAFGESRNGGLFLIGMNSSHFNKDQFVELDWLRKDLNSSFYQYILNNNIEWSRIADISDINTIDQFKEFLANSPLGSLVAIINNLLKDTVKSYRLFLFYLQLVFLRNNHFRAPPLIA